MGAGERACSMPAEPVVRVVSRKASRRSREAARRSEPVKRLAMVSLRLRREGDIGERGDRLGERLISSMTDDRMTSESAEGDGHTSVTLRVEASWPAGGDANVITSTHQ